MSRDVLEEILARAMEDDAFRNRLLTAPAQALESYRLSPQERQAFISGDLRQILLAADSPPETKGAD
ncbi:MAG: Os1348 family NHLP clan protein [bacterium]